MSLCVCVGGGGGVTRLFIGTVGYGVLRDFDGL